MLATLIRNVYMCALNEQFEEVVFIIEKDNEFLIEHRNGEYYAIGDGFEFILDSDDFRLNPEAITYH